MEIVWFRRIAFTRQTSGPWPVWNPLYGIFRLPNSEQVLAFPLDMHMEYNTESHAA
jgi:hypothetical protein